MRRTRPPNFCPNCGMDAPKYNPVSGNYECKVCHTFSLGYFEEVEVKVSNAAGT